MERACGERAGTSMKFMVLDRLAKKRAAATVFCRSRTHECFVWGVARRSGCCSALGFASIVKNAVIGSVDFL
jgi:hypothetical protein